MVAGVQMDVTVARDTLAEWLRRRPAKPMGSPRVGSNPLADFSAGRILEEFLTKARDTLAEWLRRRPAKPMGSPRVGSNPTGVEFLT